MITKKNISNISNHIICMIILMNIIQIGLSGFDVHFPMVYIEYFLIVILFIINKFKIKNYYNIILLILITIIFLFSMAFNSSKTLNFYIEQFIYFALPLIIIFLLEYNYEELFHQFFKYCLFILALYALNLVFKTSALNDYMTFGYNGIFCATYTMIYSILKKKKKTLIISLILGLMFFIYGSRGSILIIILGIIITLICILKNNTQRIMLLLCIVITIFFGDIIIKSSINNLANMFGSNSYAIAQLNNMLNEESSEGIIGPRYYIYQDCIEEIKENYLLGIGIASFQEKYSYFPHNIFLDVYSTFGIFLGTIYFAFLIAIIKKVYTISRNNTSIKTFFIFCSSIIIKLMLSKTFIYDSYIWLLIALFLNIICANKSVKNNS